MIHQITKREATITCENEMNKTFVLEYKRENDIEWISKIVSGSEIGLTDLAPNTKYQMRAYCFLGDGITKLETEIDSFTTVSCSSPEFVIGSVTTNSAVITFENAPEIESRFEYKRAIDTEWSTRIISTSSIELTNLEENTKYQVRVYCSFDETTKFDAKIDSFTTMSLGINDVSSQETIFEVYPNPAKDVLYIKPLGVSGVLEVNILDIKGIHMLSQKIICEKDNKEYKIPLTNFSKGTYFVRVSYNKLCRNKKDYDSMILINY